MSQRSLSGPSTQITKDYQSLVPGLSKESYHVLATASSIRIYHAQFGSQEWCYSRLKGSLVFGKNNEDSHSNQTAHMAGRQDVGRYWFRLLDESSGILKQVWLFKIPVVGFAYERDRPFFHAFNGMSRRFGFLFDDDDEASTFFKTVDGVTLRTVPTAVTKKRSLSFPRRKHDGRQIKGPISPSMISLPAPNSFVHVAHVGLSPSGMIESSNGISPSWTTVLSGHGVHDGQNMSPKLNAENRKVEFVGGEGYWIGGFDEFQRVDKRANEADAEVSSTKWSLKGRRRSSTRSFNIF